MEHSSRSTSRRRDKSPRHQGTSRKIAQRGEQGAMWKALDLVSSSPFSEEIERAELLKRFTAPWFEAYHGRMDRIAHISHY
jgi:hypothetical protein